MLPASSLADQSTLKLPGRGQAETKAPGGLFSWASGGDVAMSATGLEVFDKTLQTTNTWLGELMEALGADRHTAWKVLGVVLRKLRDRVPVELSAHLGAQLPLLVRGVYYDQFEPAKQPTRCDTLEQFSAEVAVHLADMQPLDPTLAVRSVFALLSRHIPEGQIGKVQDALPRHLRDAWVTAAERMEKETHRDLRARPGARMGR
jgi:uncharacterized protein (DUF2267 family)